MFHLYFINDQFFVFKDTLCSRFFIANRTDIGTGSMKALIVSGPIMFPSFIFGGFAILFCSDLSCCLNCSAVLSLFAAPHFFYFFYTGPGILIFSLLDAFGTGLSGLEILVEKCFSCKKGILWFSMVFTKFVKNGSSGTNLLMFGKFDALELLFAIKAGFFGMHLILG